MKKILLENAKFPYLTMDQKNHIKTQGLLFTLDTTCIYKKIKINPVQGKPAFKENSKELFFIKF